MAFMIRGDKVPTCCKSCAEKYIEKHEHIKTSFAKQIFKICEKLGLDFYRGGFFNRERKEFLLGFHGKEIFTIVLSVGELRVSEDIAHWCYNTDHNRRISDVELDMKKISEIKEAFLKEGEIEALKKRIQELEAE